MLLTGCSTSFINESQKNPAYNEKVKGVYREEPESQLFQKNFESKNRQLIESQLIFKPVFEEELIEEDCFNPFTDGASELVVYLLTGSQEGCHRYYKQILSIELKCGSENEFDLHIPLKMKNIYWSYEEKKGFFQTDGKGQVRIVFMSLVAKVNFLKKLKFYLDKEMQVTIATSPTIFIPKEKCLR